MIEAVKGNFRRELTKRILNEVDVFWTLSATELAEKISILDATRKKVTATATSITVGAMLDLSLDRCRDSRESSSGITNDFPLNHDAFQNWMERVDDEAGSNEPYSEETIIESIIGQTKMMKSKRSLHAY